ncbi:helix-turn-helix domain-containing protein [Flavobacterium cerinum]|uniref:AraC family transcriptional regulator n=1 Tax=Flavobacterium cerinum TaxID=2502784 RepID=A0ABY5IZG9_9FLAO|nr:AraC family transcriptional regulator [Flavobacterium cerinum]UUC46896.1 AraC family transcriptional regulator [Flavobacterium cerinum]
MKTVIFKKSECETDFLLTVRDWQSLRYTHVITDTYNTDYFEVLFFKRAKGYVELNHSEIAVTDNTIVFISPYQKRKWKLDPDHLDFTMLIFQEDFLNDFFSDKLFTYRMLYFYQLKCPLKLPVAQDEMEKYYSTLMEIKAELQHIRMDSVHIIRSLLYYLLQKLNRNYSEMYDLPLELPVNNYAYQFKQLMEVHIKEKQRIEDYCELLRISRITLNKAVKAQFNLTASQLLKYRLLLEIKNLLLFSELNVSQIAGELNFSEAAHMMRFFKQQTGITTGAFLQDYQNGRI